MMRDLSGACEVSVLQDAALTMSGCDSKESFVQKMQDGEMQFDAYTVRCFRKVSKSDADLQVLTSMCFGCTQDEKYPALME